MPPSSHQDFCSNHLFSHLSLLVIFQLTLYKADRTIISKCRSHNVYLLLLAALQWLLAWMLEANCIHQAQHHLASAFFGLISSFLPTQAMMLFLILSLSPIRSHISAQPYFREAFPKPPIGAPDCWHFSPLQLMTNCVTLSLVACCLYSWISGVRATPALFNIVLGLSLCLAVGHNESNKYVWMYESSYPHVFFCFLKSPYTKTKR